MLLQLWPWLPVISGYFYGIIHSINGVFLVLITDKWPYVVGDVPMISPFLFHNRHDRSCTTTWETMDHTTASRHSLVDLSGRRNRSKTKYTRKGMVDTDT